ncbi:hypothetical protein VTN77DRAFT_2666 [Rasamsonia byssochlamydoides]|uniref:uncharacterized protein n=1 Tax=Rasamsonia byssochlamydoides TaxID=89139 RepID=UPI0037439548
MLGGTGLTRSATAARMASTRLTAPLRSSRSLSSIASRSFRNPVSLRTGVWGNASWKPVSSASRLSFARFNSTSSAATSATPADAASQAGSTNIADLSPLDIEQIPENVGYLKELGLDYGWGPSSMVEWTIEHIHIWTGLPWWASIVATGLLVRLALLKPAIMASDNAAKILAIRERSNSIRERIYYHTSTGNSIEMMKARAELQDLNREHDIKAWKSFVPLLQIPFGFGCYRVVNGMSSLPVPGLAAESLGWIADLTVRDPYFLLPAATTVLMYLTVKKGGEAGLNQFQGTALGRMMLYGLPALSFCFMAFFPSSLQLYFVTTGLFSLGQTSLLNSPGFRRWAGIAPLARDRQATAEGAEGSRRLRLIEDYVQAEATQATKEHAATKNQVSFIDRIVDSVKENLSGAKRELTDKVNRYSRQAPMGANGSPALPPRLSQRDLKTAEEYQKRRQAEEEYKREERNHARREAYLRFLEAEKEKAGRAWLSKNDPKLKARQ